MRLGKKLGNSIKKVCTQDISYSFQECKSIFCHAYKVDNGVDDD